ncbi:non-ribosomal peptide synthetase [Mycobacterium hubeiense]|uniref:non-ribosomal peptide synthetase n=1 Tax=Mycobacterium hubeiense TaxID=1867256 RepID=UPI000C7EC248|nr:non-ribosomal peptide synthetase [Mycobacterium sp. QGD 101]
MTSTDTKPAIEDVMALSPLQQGLFSMAALTDREDGADPYTIAMAADVTGRLDVELLRDCAATMLVRHPNLRASFFRGELSRPVQVIPSHVEVPWRHVSARPEDVEALEAEERRRPFDLERGPAIRFLLIELPDERWHLVVVAHHIVIDGWSLPLFVGELITLYRCSGDTAALPPSPRPYRDYIGWLATRDPEASRSLWRQHLAGLDGPTLLTPALTGAEAPAGIPRRTELRLDRHATGRLAEAARSRGVTVNTLFQIAWATLLSAFTDRGDVVFGVTVSGRPSELTGVETMIGLFINTVPLRVRLNPAQPVGAQCVALQREAAALRDHSYLGHAELRALGGVGEMFDTLLVYENFPPGGVVGGTEFTANGATFYPAALESLSHFPVTIAAHLTDGELIVLVEVIDGALGPMSPESLGTRVLSIVQRLIDRWDSPLRDVGVLLDDERERIQARGATRSPAVAGCGVHTKFTEIAGGRLGSVAVTWHSGQMTYRELDEAADRVAAALVARGVRSETPVAIKLSRGPDYVVSMLGVLKAGGMIVPLDPAMPAVRIDDILAQAAVHVVVDDALIAAATDEPPPDYRPATVCPQQAAYVVFTSGTTGRPKGVVGTHEALLAYADDHAQHILRPAATRIGRPLRIAHAWSFTFDAAWQPLAALLDGHSVHVIGDEVQRDAEALVETIGRFGLDMIDTTPSMFAQLHNVGLLSTVPLTVLALGGEAVGVAAWRLIQDECARTGMSAYNCYGPTETTVEAVVATIAEHAQPSIGHPTRPTVAHVLDSWLRPVPDGVAGELYLAGDQLTRGYLGRPAETAGRFVADPFVPGRRMYRTGDVVRRGPDGALQFLGRTDDQVKIRGFRVEPSEISAVLHSHPAVRHAHVAVRRHASGPRLIAYVAAGENPPSVSELRGMLTKRLPRYLVPHHIVVVGELPLTTHGKVDESALTAIDFGEIAATAPETATEAALAELLCDVLDAPQVDVTAEFLEMGLDSIAALSLVQAARRRGIEMRARLMLECNTIRELAAAIDNGVGPHGPAGVDADRYGEVLPAPIVSWMYECGNFRRFTQDVIIALPPDMSGERLEEVLQALLDRHDMLRSVLEVRDGRYRLTTRPPGSVRAADVLHRVDAPAEAALAAESRAAQNRIDPTTGSMIQAVSFAGRPACLLMCVHHLATDVVSWYVMLAGMAQIAADLNAGETPKVATEYTTYREFCQLLDERSRTDEVTAQREYWTRQLGAPDPALGRRLPDPTTDTWGSLRRTDVATDSATTRRILDKVDGSGIEMRDFLLAALTMTITSWQVSRGQSAEHGALIALEGHGREDSQLASSVDTSATVGWFTSVYPVRLGAGDKPVDVQTAQRDPDAARALVDNVAKDVAAVPNRGLDYGLLRYHRADPALVAARHPQVEFNYIGRYDLSADPAVRAGADTSPWSLITDAALNEQLPLAPEPDLPLRYTFDVIAVVTSTTEGPQLMTSWRRSEKLSTAAELDELAELWRRAIDVLGEAL